MKQNWALREAHVKSLSEMEEFKRFQGSTFDTVARRKLVENRDTFLELTCKIQELRNEINCMNDSRDFQDAESISTQWTFTLYQSTCVFPTSSSSWWNAEPVYRNAEPQRWAAKHLGHAWCIGQRFCKSRCVIFSTLSAGIEFMGSHISEPIHSSQAAKNGNQTPVQDLRCQSGPSAKSSVIFSGGVLFKELWGRPTTIADLRSSF